MPESAKGWAKKINPNMLLIRSNLNCVLGQVFKGDPYKGMKKLGLEEKDAPRHGFMHHDSEDGYSRTLEDRWREEIASRVPARKSGTAKAVPAEEEPKLKKSVKKATGEKTVNKK